MRISVIGGTGDLGSALAARLAAVGHEIWIGSRDPAKAEAFVKTVEHGGTGRLFGAGLADAAGRCDVCFLTVPYEAHARTLEQIREAVQGKIVVDATVPLKPPKVGTVQLPAAGSAVMEARQLLGEGVRIVSALQNIGAEKLGADTTPDAEVLVAGDDAASVEVVRELLAELGFKSWHVGPLPNSAAAEALTSVLIQLNRRYKLGQAGIRITGGVKKKPALQVFPVEGLPMLAPGDDLAAAIAGALDQSGVKLEAGDVVVTAQKAVSKVEGRFARLAEVAPSAAAREAAAKSGKPAAVAELILSEAREVMRVADNLIIVRNRSGQVLANAGIDASNVAPGNGDDDEQVLLWPQDPNESARRLRAALEAHAGVKLAVIVSDSLGRAWRMGTTGSAIGAAGIRPIRDRRGEKDLFGRELKATVIGVADEIAAAASLVMGEADEGVPAAVIRGAVYEASDQADISELIRPLDQDLFR
jgi:coenzyme F420-0:L-glutamate ligase/NADPH-dependent F420 reductase